MSSSQISFFQERKQKKRDYPVVRFTKDCKDLNKDFIKGSEFRLFAERDGKAVIRIDNFYYTIKNKEVYEIV